MGKSIRQAVTWAVVGMMLMGIVVWFAMPALMIIKYKSARSYEETVAALREAVEKKSGWKVLAVYDFQKSIKDAGQGNIERVGSVALCHPRYASSILTEDANRRVSAFMPVGIGVHEDKQGQVYIARLDVGLMGMMFGGTIADVMSMAGKDLGEVASSVAAK